MELAPTFPSPTSRRQSTVLEPVLLLLLLEKNGSHGYDLANRARRLSLTGPEVEPSSVYRCLRWFEKEGLVRSEWDNEGPGASRRRYFLTDLGVKSLRLWADALKRQRGVLDEYLGRYRMAIPQAMAGRGKQST
ncbi:MAG: helix-turn-helix transcriptional regulator [Armatimonadia bacterium]